jgi:TonB family protein
LVTPLGGDRYPYCHFMEIATAPPIALDSKFTEFNIREDVGIPHFVRLHDKATKRFERHVRGFGPTPGGGSRAGGILLGTLEASDQCFIDVMDFTPVLCEHRRDGRASFLDCPAQCFRNAIRRANENSRKNHSIVGYYRSSDGPAFSLEKEDHDLLKKYFAQDFRSLLLIKPSPGGLATAVFYLGLEGQLHPDRSSVEFPLSLKELGGEEPPELDEPEKVILIPSLKSSDEPIRVVAREIQASVAPVPEPTPAVVSANPTVPPQRVEELVRQSRRSEQFWKGAAAAAILLGSVFAVRSIVTTNRPQTIEQQAPAASATPASPTVPAAPVGRATTDAPKPQAKLQPEAIARVEDPRRVVVAPPPAAPEPKKVPSTQPVEVRKFNPPPPKAAPANSPLSAAPEMQVSRAVTPLPAPTLPPPPMPVTPNPPSASQPPAINRVEAPANQPVVQTPVRTPPPAVVVNTVPQGPLKPARLVRQSTPVLPEQIKRKLRGDVIVVVRVDLDAAGKVINAVATTKSTKQTESLTGLAVEAARQSQFEPATQGEQKVAGQATLQFRFEGEVIRLPVQSSIR